MKKHIHFLVVFLTLILVSSCREDFEPTLSDGGLEFSKDTLFLDTVFSNISSSTYRFKVFNRSANLITIPQVGLAKGENSAYRLNIDGRAGKTFQNVELLPKDSIFIFVEITADAALQNTNQFLYTDQIHFDSDANLQKVELVTLLQDAVFLFPKRNAQGIKETLNLGTNADGEPVEIEGFLLNDEQLTFTNEKPYVIYGYAGIAATKTLTINPGARLHFHQNSGIILANNARLEAKGRLSEDQTILENEIILEGDRLEPQFADVPGQWGTIWFTPGSIGNLNYTTIKNNTFGLLAEGPSAMTTAAVTLSNTQIYNTALVGLYGLNGSVLGENLVVGNSGISNLWLRLGGDYTFVHSTFANYWTQSFRNTPAVQIDNFLETEAELQTADLTKAYFTNCIIYGNKAEELILSRVVAAGFNFKFENCLIRFDDQFNDFADLAEYDFTNEAFYKDIVRSENPLFKNTLRNDYRIDLTSPAKNIGNPQASQQVPLDILGISRAASSDAGAYQSTTFE